MGQTLKTCPTNSGYLNLFQAFTTAVLAESAVLGVPEALNLFAVAYLSPRFGAAIGPPGRSSQPPDPLPSIDPVTEAELAEFAESRIWLTGSPIDEAELMAAIERDSH